MQAGCYTAIATPFSGNRVDDEGLARLVDFQIQSGITGIIAVGTTGESPTLSWEEHNRVIGKVSEMAKGKCACIAGTGSNNTQEAIEGTGHAAQSGVDAVLLVDPYYNGPSSLEIRREYVEPVAAAYPDLEVIPYVIPGRTGAQLLPEDLALLFQKHPNVSTVKEATGDLDNMRRTRACCGPQYTIFSGDDGMTWDMMATPDIKAAGVISVISNIVPRAMVEYVALLGKGDFEEARKLRAAIEPLFGLVTVKTTEQTLYGEVVCRARNPLGLKTLMAVLGMPSGNCRQPLGKMTRNGIEKVLDIARQVQSTTPEIFRPIGEFFNVNIDERLNDAVFVKGLSYDTYE